MFILTFDIEEWFHILENNKTKNESDWNGFESRISLGMDLIYDVLEKVKSPATFFVVGWIAQKYPEIIREISDRGFEIGSHTHMHQLAYNQDRLTFYNDIEKSIKTIEDCIGVKVNSFRAPGFSITQTNLWAFEILHELGITKDSSIFPTTRSHGGLVSNQFKKPSLIEYNGIIIKEFPINTHNILGRSFVFSGGGYFRFMPYSIIKNWTLQSDYVMSYFHPRDFDINQPIVPGLSLLRLLKSYIGINKCKYKLETWLNDFEFNDLNSADLSINWKEAQIVKF